MPVHQITHYCYDLGYFVGSFLTMVYCIIATCFGIALDLISMAFTIIKQTFIEWRSIRGLILICLFILATFLSRFTDATGSDFPGLRTNVRNTEAGKDDKNQVQRAVRSLVENDTARLNLNFLEETISRLETRLDDVLRTVGISECSPKDISSFISRLIDPAVLQYGNYFGPDFALHSAGANVIPTLTSKPFEICQTGFPSKILGLFGSSRCVKGRPPVTALHHDLHNGHCWPLAGTEGQLGVVLAAPIYISNVTIDHVSRDAAFDTRSAPREMELWAMVDGEDNIAKVKTWREAMVTNTRGEEMGYSDGNSAPGGNLMNLQDSPQYLRIATFTYDLHAPHNIQTFPVDEEISRLGVDFSIVILKIRSNWGRAEYTCLYRFRVHGQIMHDPLVNPGGDDLV